MTEDAETFHFQISNAQGGGGPSPIIGTSAVSTTINASDPLNERPEEQQNIGQVDIRLAVSPETVNEGAGSTGFTVTATRDGSTQDEAVTIQLSLGGTATPGSTGDYTAPSTASVTIPANQASGSGTLTLTILDDTEVEGDETITVGGNSGNLGIKSADITIHDDEATYLSITGPAAAVNEGASANFTVTLSKAVTQAVTVAWNAVFAPVIGGRQPTCRITSTASGSGNLPGQQRRRG